MRQNLRHRPEALPVPSDVANRIGTSESVAGGTVRIMVESLHRGVTALVDRPEGDDAAIHTARKSIKRTRSMLRLVRDEVDRDAYAAIDGRLRRAGRVLASVRDAAVLVSCLEDTRARYAHLLDPDAFHTVDTDLRSRHGKLLRATLEDDTVVEAAVSTMTAATDRISDWSPTSPVPAIIRDEFAAVGPGLTRTYRRGRKASVVCAGTGTTEEFHRWRRQVKYLRYQTEALSTVRLETIGALAGRLDTIGEALGTDHDLALLGNLVHSLPAVADDERRLLVSLVQQRRAGLQSAALTLAETVYQETPAAFTERFGSYWATARGG